MDTRLLTRRQSEIYEFLVERIGTGVPPTVREIGKRFEIGSPNGVMCHLKALEKKGYITREAVLSRSIRLVQIEPIDPVCCPNCGVELVAAGEPAA